LLEERERRTDCSFPCFTLNVLKKETSHETKGKVAGMFSGAAACAISAALLGDEEGRPDQSVRGRLEDFRFCRLLYLQFHYSTSSIPSNIRKCTCFVDEGTDSSYAKEVG